jgi:hypothetical protein
MTLNIKYKQQISVTRTRPDREQTGARHMFMPHLIGRYNISKELQLSAHSLSLLVRQTPLPSNRAPSTQFPSPAKFNISFRAVSPRRCHRKRKAPHQSSGNDTRLKYTNTKLLSLKRVHSHSQGRAQVWGREGAELQPTKLGS